MTPATGRVIGIDLGAIRVGVAISDSEQTVASGLTVLSRSGDLAADHEALARVVVDEGAVGVVIGLPLSLDGTVGPAARGVLDEMQPLMAVMPVPVETWDERFTTVTAARALRLAVRGAQRARRVVDREAAAAMLQSWLDRRRAGR